MKKITLLLSFIACSLVGQAQLLVNENFDYTANTALLNQGGWAVTGSNSSAPFITVTSKSISYANYINSEIGNEVTLTNGEDLNRNFTAQTTGNVYASFLVNIVAAPTPTAGEYFIHFGPTDMAANAYIGRTFVKADAGKLAFGIMQASSGTVTYSSSIYELNTTYLIVLKHDIIGKVSSIIINPAISTTEPTTNWLTNSTGNNSTTNIGSIGLRQPSASTALTAKLDGIRVATSWSDLFSTTAGTSNPSTSNFKAYLNGKQLIVKNANTSVVEIYSALGAKVQNLQLVNGVADMSDFTNGLYIVRAGKQAAKIMLKD